MDAAAVLVTIGGAALAAFILWFFLGPRASPKSARIDGETERGLR